MGGVRGGSFRPLRRARTSSEARPGRPIKASVASKAAPAARGHSSGRSPDQVEGERCSCVSLGGQIYRVVAPGGGSGSDGVSRRGAPRMRNRARGAGGVKGVAALRAVAAATLDPSSSAAKLSLYEGLPSVAALAW